MKTKTIIIVTIFIFLITSCKSPTPEPTTTPSPRPTFTLRPTYTSSPSPIPTRTPDLNDLGNPQQKIAYKYPSFLPSSYFSFDEDQYYIYEEKMHGTNVYVAIHKDNEKTEKFRQEFADFVFNTFAFHWEVFQGFPYNQFIVKVLPPTSTQNAITATGIGFLIVTNPEYTNIPWFKNSYEYRQYVTHEAFHAWNGQTIMPEGQFVAHIRPEDWFHEGITQYYGYRGTPDDLDFYQERINASWNYYISRIDTEYDLPLVELSGKGVNTKDFQFTQMYYDKGACVAYFLDKKLLNEGLSLDYLMRYLYENFGLTGRRYVTEDILFSLEEISNQDWSDFFDKYVYGTEVLPLDGKFEYLEH